MGLLSILTVAHPNFRNVWPGQAFALVISAVFSTAHAGCPDVTFQVAVSLSLKPSVNSHTVLLRQNDSSYTAFELTDTAPYRIVRTTPNIQKQVTGCPGIPVSGFQPVIQPPESLTRLSSGGYLWVRRSDVNGPPGGYFALIVVVFDSSMNFVSEAQYPIAIVEAFAVADVNGDGIPDILTGTAFPHNAGLQVLLGNGGSSFQAPVTYPIASSLNVQQVVVADLNGDGKPDAVVAAGGKIAVFLGNGDGTFQPERTIATGASSQTGIAIADLNRDGKPDLVYTSADSVEVALGAGDGSFGAPSKYAAGWGGSVAIADLNGDGMMDIVTSGFTILFGDGQGRFPNRADYWQGTDGNIILADFDGDGQIDIISGMGSAGALAGPTVAVLFGRGGGTFAGPGVSSVPGLPAPNNSVRGVAAADFDGDGAADLLVLELPEIDVLKGSADGKFRAVFRYAPANGYPQSSAIADFNRDGKPDLVLGINGTLPRIEVLLGTGDGTFQAPIAATAPGSFSALTVADFNGDGRTDVAALVNVAGAASDQVLIYLGNGAGGLAAPVSYPAGTRAQSLAVADFNRDGKPDIVIASLGTFTAAGAYVGGQVSILFGQGNGLFTAPAPIALGIDNPPAAGVTAADFNGDGLPDLVVALNDPVFNEKRRLLVLLGRGDGTFRTPVVYPFSNSTTGSFRFAAVDLNGDGIPDLVSEDAATWLLGNGDGTFQAQVLFTPAGHTFLGAVAVADFNRDGKPDLAGGVFVGGIATLMNISQPAPLTVVSAASFAAVPLSPDSLATVFGGNIGAGATVTVAGIPASVLYSSAQQVNFLIPAGLPMGVATVSVNGASAPLQLVPVAPAIFTQNPEGLAAAYVVRVRRGNQTIESVAGPIDLGPPGDQVYLSLFGTGIRGAAGRVTVRIQGIDVPVTYAGPQPQFPGLDQVNVLLPRELAGAGYANVVVNAAGNDAPTVHVSVN